MIMMVSHVWRSPWRRKRMERIESKNGGKGEGIRVVDIVFIGIAIVLDDVVALSGHL